MTNDEKYDETLELLACAVHNFRCARGYSQQELADLSDLDRKTINRIERRRHVPRVTAVLAIADALNVNVAALLDPYEYNEVIRIVEEEEEQHV